jgi:hypothetical protein
MKLQRGDTIRVTLADDKSRHRATKYVLLAGAETCEWDGEVFLGCTKSNGERVRWSPRKLRAQFSLSHGAPEFFTNIDGMVEQLIAEGAL